MRLLQAASILHEGGRENLAHEENFLRFGSVDTASIRTPDITIVRVAEVTIVSSHRTDDSGKLLRLTRLRLRLMVLKHRSYCDTCHCCKREAQGF